MKRTGSAVWQGDVKSGQGTTSTESGVLKDEPYGFNTRFENGTGTNPEELLGAAHASCFSMALSMILGEAGLTPDEIETKAAVSLEKQGEGFAITAVHLTVKARIPGADDAAFQKAAEGAKENCPVSKLFNAKITMDATLAN